MLATNSTHRSGDGNYACISQVHAGKPSGSYINSLQKAAKPKQVQMNHRMTAKVQQITVSERFSVATEESID